jgi:hypothetical protein
MKPIDYTLYNKVKAKFPPPPVGTIIFVSLAPENLEELKGILFKEEDYAGLRTLIGEHGRETIPYAAIGGLTEDDVGYNFSCHEFEQEEDLLTGKIVAFSVESYHNNLPSIEDLKKEMNNFVNGTLLTGNA